MNRLEKALVMIMKEQALANAMEELYTEEWRKLGVKGEYAVDLLCTMRELIDGAEKEIETVMEE